MKEKADEVTQEEAERRRDITLKVMLHTKPQPNWRPTDIADDGRSTRREKKAKASS